MILSDVDLRAAIESGELSCSGGTIQPASIDVHLGEPPWLSPAEPLVGYPVSPWAPPRGLWRETEAGRLDPGEFRLVSTAETVAVGRALAASVAGKSSLGRIGLSVHVTAGFIDPGFVGQITLELVNLSPWPLILTPGLPIAQISVTRLSTACEIPYGDIRLGSHYQGQVGPRPSCL